MKRDSLLVYLTKQAVNDFKKLDNSIKCYYLGVFLLTFLAIFDKFLTDKQFQYFLLAFHLLFLLYWAVKFIIETYFLDYLIIEHPKTGSKITVYRNYDKQKAYEKSTGITFTSWFTTENNK